MTGSGWTWLVAGMLWAAAVAVAIKTTRVKRAMRGTAVWLVPYDSRIAHAFRVRTSKRCPAVTSLRLCGTWPVVALEPDDSVERCWPCQVAVTALDGDFPLILGARRR
jgi:hypothetical protein